MKSRLLALASFRFYRKHPWQLILAVAGIALGIAVFVGIQLANDNARRAFDLSSSTAQGQVSHRLLPTGDFLDEASYFALKRDQRFIDSAPIIELDALLVLPDGRQVRVTLRGIDMLEEPALRSPGELAGLQQNALRLLTEANAILVPQAIEALLNDNDSIEISAGSNSRTVRVIGSIESGQGTGTVVLTDLATVQSITGQSGRLSRIDLALDEASAAALNAALPEGSVLVPAAEDDALRELTRAFNTNLSVLGLLALVVGMFLIYSTISFTIVQRTRSIAVLRAIGLERRELLTLLLGEAVMIGVIGTILGLLLGRLLSSVLLELVLRTIGDLYFRRSLAEAEASSLIYLVGGMVGLVATLLSSLFPAVLASRREITASARSSIERSARRISRLFAWISLPVFVGAAAVLILGSESLQLGYLALGLVLAGGAMLVPFATRVLMRGTELPLGMAAGIAGRMAARGVTDSLSRTGVATTALAVAVATVMSIGLMIGSFRTSLIEWIDTTAAADLYLDAGFAASGNGDESDVITGLQAGIEALPGVTGTSAMQVTPVATAYGQLSLRAVDPGPEGFSFDLAEPAGALATELLATTNSLLIAEPLAYRLGLGIGNRIALPAAGGLTEFTIAGIYRDYNTGGSEIAMPLDHYRELFDDRGVSSIGIHLEPGADETSVIAAVRELPGGQSARIRSTARIREISLLVFDQTFQITEVLRLLASIVAFLGIMSAVMALQLEREREFAVLRSLGMSVRQLFGQNLAQTALLGLAAGLAAMPIGTALAWLLVHVINRRSFGWSMDFILAPGILASGLAMAIGAAVLAGLYPGIVGARADTSLAWRDD